MVTLNINNDWNKFQRRLHTILQILRQTSQKNHNVAPVEVLSNPSYNLKFKLSDQKARDEVKILIDSIKKTKIGLSTWIKQVLYDS